MAIEPWSSAVYVVRVVSSELISLTLVRTISNLRTTRTGASAGS